MAKEDEKTSSTPGGEIVRSSEKILQLQQLIENYLRISSDNPDPDKQSLESLSYPLYSLGENNIEQVVVRADRQEVSGRNAAHIQLTMRYHEYHLSLYLDTYELARGKISGLSAESYYVLTTPTAQRTHAQIDEDTEKFLGDQLEPQALQALANFYGQEVTSVKVMFPEYRSSKHLRERGYAPLAEGSTLYTKVFTPQN